MTTVVVVVVFLCLFVKKQQKKDFTKQRKKNWNVDVDNIVTTKLVDSKFNSKYLIGYLDKIVRSLALILLKMSEYVNTFKFKFGDTDNLLQKAMISYQKTRKPFELKLKTEKIELNALPVLDNRYTKIKIRTYGNDFYTNFRGLIVLECESFAIISIDSLPVYKPLPASIFRQFC